MALLPPPPPPTPATGTAAPKKRIGKYFWKDMVMRVYLPSVLKVLANAGIHDPTKRRVYYTLIQMFQDVPKSKTKGYATLLDHIADAQLRRGAYEDWDGYNYTLGMFRDDSRQM